MERFLRIYKLEFIPHFPPQTAKWWSMKARFLNVWQQNKMLQPVNVKKSLHSKTLTTYLTTTYTAHTLRVWAALLPQFILFCCPQPMLAVPHKLLQRTTFETLPSVIMASKALKALSGRKGKEQKMWTFEKPKVLDHINAKAYLHACALNLTSSIVPSMISRRLKTKSIHLL